MTESRSPSLRYLSRRPDTSECLPLLPRQHPTRELPRLFQRPPTSSYQKVYTEDNEDDLRRSSVSILDFHRHNAVPLPYHPNQPFFKKLFASLFSVLNPNSSLYDLAQGVPLGSDACSVRLGDLEYGDRDHPTRVDILNALRPEKLIGNYKVLADWSKSYCGNAEKIRCRPLRYYYDDQNYLIERYKEIDQFLDNGQMHLNMLSTYTNNGCDENKTHVQEDDFEPGVAMSKSVSRSRHNELPGNITEGGQFLGVDSEHDTQVYVAIMVNFFINFLLLIGKVVIALMTNSLSVVASLVDSVLDFLSTFIIFIANRLSTTKNWKTEIAYPVGRTKLEPLGILVFSVIIIISFFQVGLESFKKLFMDPTKHKLPVKIGWDAVLIMLTTILAKVGCWVWCASSKSSSVQALAQDAMTDIVFNSFSLVMPVTGYTLGIWWLDPVGALLLSIYVIVSWSMTAFEHIENLAGAVADPKDYKVVLYMAYRFAECIKQITALKVYHAGDNLNVEIDIVFDTENFDLTFRDAHDIAEALQYALETLPMVERAFVHIDYMEGNFRGHLT